MVFDTLWRGRNGDQNAEATPEPPHPATDRPSIALGGGAALGFAHIGVIRTLAAHGIKPTS